ncbi:lamin tail domain-containing protein [Sinomicrobium soli]|uniref:lamin tail domain-containing protein n=1 Tax=Sinomicrobium sp. N-1-3-6 TaxID=2219864 RepID=UPI000DCEA857|nr:lamin tail domain-containing protein [Sinomicrobium sp. N-1-3-6]RAV29141.1 hypothetical protein DN748_09455 [Sinomicrobium sp. N-1-3-6]
MKTITPFLYVLYTTVLLLGVASCKTDDVEEGSAVIPSEPVPIPDAAFGEYMVYNGTPGVYEQTEGNEVKYYLDPLEAASVSELVLSKTGSNIETLQKAGLATAGIKISDLTGLEYFIGLQRLVLTSNTVRNIDLSALIALEQLEINFNLIGQLDLSGNPGLTTLRYRASGNANESEVLTELDLGTNTQLRHLFLPGHQLVNIDLSNNLQIDELLDMSDNPGPDGDPETADIVVPAAIYNQLEEGNRIGVISDAQEDDDKSVPLVLNEILYDPSNNGLDGDANGDGTYAQNEDEFIELYNNSDEPLDVSGFKIYDTEALENDSPRHLIPESTVIPAHGVLVIFGGGTPTGEFGGAIVQTSTTGDLNLNNAEDVLTVTDTAGKVIITFDVEPLSDNPNESYTRSPDITGDFTRHSDINSLLFSPGTKADGSSFNP